MCTPIRDSIWILPVSDSLNELVFKKIDVWFDYDSESIIQSTMIVCTLYSGIIQLVYYFKIKNRCSTVDAADISTCLHRYFVSHLSVIIISISLLFPCAFAVAQLSLYENIAIPVESNRINRFSGVNRIWIEIILANRPSSDDVVVVWIFFAIGVLDIDSVTYNFGYFVLYGT